jgi:hypothetical protein
LGIPTLFIVSLKGRKINAKKNITVKNKMTRMSFFSVMRCMKKLATNEPFNVAIANAIAMLTPTVAVK